MEELEIEINHEKEKTQGKNPIQTHSMKRPIITKTNNKMLGILYSNKDHGPFDIYVESTQHNINHLHPIAMGKLFYDQNIQGIEKLTKLGRNRIKLTFDSQENANRFLNHNILNTKPIQAYIPFHKVFIKGIMRGIDTQFQLSDLIPDIETPFGEVIELQRMTRKYYNDGVLEYRPTQTVVVTFRAHQLPQYIRLYKLEIPIETYIQKAQMCTKCSRFGHSDNKCRSKARCSRCAEEHLSSTCRSLKFLCANCGGPHKASDTFCPKQVEQKNIYDRMNNFNLPYCEVIHIREKTNTYRPQKKEFPALNSTQQNENIYQPYVTILQNAPIPASQIQTPHTLIEQSQQQGKRQSKPSLPQQKKVRGPPKTPLISKWKAPVQEGYSQSNTRKNTSIYADISNSSGKDRKAYRGQLDDLIVSIQQNFNTILDTLQQSEEKSLHKQVLHLQKELLDILFSRPLGKLFPQIQVQTNIAEEESTKRTFDIPSQKQLLRSAAEDEEAAMFLATLNQDMDTE